MFLLLIASALLQQRESLRSFDTLAGMLLDYGITPYASAARSQFSIFGWKYAASRCGMGLVGIAMSKLIVTTAGLLFASIRAIDFSVFVRSKLNFNLSQLLLTRQSFPAAAIQLLVPIYLIMLTKIMTSYALTAVAALGIELQWWLLFLF